ncbi:hypothetical protein P43SY_006484 [Pythium insidiosum]|uniref:t-SNARE coiled-coil homology domain-containing protein n=1 Tax=Pythium insidiosum TaxID=114742 RepID=A0AAD5M0B6_PYTIN|nr:hypothetical protein P43SY_006484 [Pythium insidiosum]
MAGIAATETAAEAGGASLAIETNVFRLCELKAVEWRAFRPAVASGGDDVDAIDVGHDWGAQSTQSASHAATSFLPVVRFIQQHALLYTWASHPDPISQGRWDAGVENDELFPSDVREQLLRALQLQLMQRLVARGEFRVVENEWLVPREPEFIYQCPSLSRMHQLEVYLTEAHAMPACRPRVRHISGHANVVVVNVEMVIRILEEEAKQGKDVVAKRKMEDQVRHCRTLHASLRSNLEKHILIGDSRAKTAEAPVDMTQKQAMTRYAERLETNGRHLDEAQRTIAETEAIAANTANNLLHQRNQLQHAQVDVDQAQEDTKEAGSHLRRMARKALTNKLVLLFLILCLAAAIVLVSYFKWYPRDKKDYLGILPTQAPASG